MLYSTCLHTSTCHTNPSHSDPASLPTQSQLLQSPHSVLKLETREKAWEPHVTPLFLIPTSSPQGIPLAIPQKPHSTPPMGTAVWCPCLCLPTPPASRTALFPAPGSQATPSAQLPGSLWTRAHCQARFKGPTDRELPTCSPLPRLLRDLPGLRHCTALELGQKALSQQGLPP